MPSIFRKPGESSSADESHVTDSSEAEESEGSKIRQSGSNVEEKALSPKSGRFSKGSSSRIVSFPNLTQHHQDCLFHVSLMEKQSRTTVARIMNQTREPDDHLPEDNPQVRSLAAQIISPAAKDWSEKTGLSPDLVGEDGAAFRDTLNAAFEDYLTKAALRALRKLESSSSPKAVGASFVGFGPFLKKTPSSPTEPGGSAQSLMSGANRSPFKQDSPYKNEYQEISILGKGGYGQVFRVRSHLDKQEYAIKKIVITSQRVRKYLQADQIDGLLAEVQTLARLNHPNVVRYYHVWIEYEATPFHSNSTGSSSSLSGDSSLLKKPKTHETGAKYESAGSLGVGKLEVAGEHEGVLRKSQDFMAAFSEERLDNNVVFGYSSMHNSHDAQMDSARIRRASHNTAISNIASQTSTLSVAQPEEDPEIEVIPRATPAMHTVRGEQSAQAEQSGQDITLCIKMSLYPMTLFTYLSMEPPKASDSTELRHCFHSDSSVGILTAILDGLEFLHSQGIIHRDIKPANIFLSIHEGDPPATKGCVNIIGCSECAYLDSQRGIYITPCIGDFGLSAEYKSFNPMENPESDPQIPLFEPSRPSKIQQKPVGTMFYRPSSMPKEEPIICPKLDVYSLGVIALELIHKFATRSERAIVLSKLKQGILPVELEDHVMAEGIKSMVCEERDRRWDCGTVRKWLEGMTGKGKRAI